MVEAFSILVEFAVAISGFSGITIALQSREGEVDALRSFRNRVLLAWSLCAAFGALSPQGGALLGLTGGDLWSFAGLFVSALMFVAVASGFIGRSRLSQQDRAKLNPAIWRAGVVGSGVVALVLLANTAIGLGVPPPAAVFWSLVWMIGFAALNFYRNLFGPS